MIYLTFVLKNVSISLKDFSTEFKFMCRPLYKTREFEFNLLSLKKTCDQTQSFSSTATNGFSECHFIK